MFRRFNKITGMSAIALSALVAPGCGDDDDDNGERDAGGEEDAGGLDAGGDGDGDAGLDAGGDGDAGVLACTGGDDAGGDAGAVSCEGRKIATITLPPCCVDDSALCGLDVSDIETISGGLFAGCIQTDQPSVPAGKKVSVSCTALWESLDEAVAADAGVDGGASAVDGWTVSVAGQSVSFAGCCRLNDDGDGECGFLADEILGQEIGFGCVSIDTFKSAFPDEATFNQVKAAAVCDPETGELPQGDAGVNDAGAEDAGTDAAAEDAGADASNL